MEKETSRAFAKKIYLLGRDSEKNKYWLEEASWDCEWYWGFGYVVSYTNNNNPAKAKDIKSHLHLETSILGKGNGKNGSYCHNPYDSIFFADTTFNKEEGWELGELFSQYYLLQKSAEYFNLGTSHIGKTKIQNFKDADIVNKINNVILPVIFNRIYEILGTTKVN